jgi:hypothetical protein
MAPTTPAIGRRVRMSAFLPLQASTTKTRGLRHDVRFGSDPDVQARNWDVCFTTGEADFVRERANVRVW